MTATQPVERILFYDFETTGLIDPDLPDNHEDQPHIVQVAAALVSAETRRTIASINLICRPMHWVIPPAATEVHGITQEQARQVGVGEDKIVDLISSFHRMTDLRIAHNEPFDARIMSIGLARYNPGYRPTWQQGRAECTAVLAQPIVKEAPTAAMLATNRRHYKTPNLAEVYQHFFGEPPAGRHSAMGDVRALMAIYWQIKDRCGK